MVKLKYRKPLNSCCALLTFSEAEYTFQLKKPILPLMMQRFYKPDGWLGIMLGAKFYVNMDGKFPFEQAYTMMVREMGHIFGAPKDDGKLI